VKQRYQSWNSFSLVIHPPHTRTHAHTHTHTHTHNTRLAAP